MQDTLLTLGILFVFALIGGILAARFKQPILLGLLLVGAVIGPNALGLIHDANILSMMIDFGAILMLFVIGLEFDISKLKKIGLKAIVVGMLKSSIVVFVGFAVSLMLGLGVTASLFIGIILAFSSTVVIVKVLEEKDLMSRQEVPLLIAVLIIEDILAVIILTFFSGIKDKSTGIFGSMESLAISMIALVAIYFIFVKFIKPILSWVLTHHKGEEIFTFTALAMCAGFSYLAYCLKLSPAAGAFLAGSIVASLPDAKVFEKVIAPYNLMISSFFFIAVGTLINYTSIKTNIMIILILVLVVIITRLFSFGLIVYLFANFKGDKMFFSSIAMFSVGEFALLIAQESLNFNTGIDLISISAAIIFATAILMSLTLGHSDKLYAPTKDSIPWKLRKKMDKFADYIKAISEELDLENKYSRGLKKNMLKVLMAITGIIIVIFGWREALEYSSYINISNIGMLAGYFGTLAILTMLMFYFIFVMQKIIKSLADIFANATNSRANSNTVVKRAFAGFTLFGIGLLWPFAMFLFTLSAVWISVSGVLLILAFWQFHKISASMDDNLDVVKNNFPKYRKIKFSDYADTADDDARN